MSGAGKSARCRHCETNQPFIFQGSTTYIFVILVSALFILVWGFQADAIPEFRLVGGGDWYTSFDGLQKLTSKMQIRE